MCYYFWGILEGEPLSPTAYAPDWAWAEWVEQQGIGE
jgi:hypothetical protein